eukprot:TRINITY_DN44785_c0_g1_i1.p1 TRINITY_DN44785_c0_g1~~TRINITY_DN44785_c0_g1_i1.p1  ORF type:complete len:501 (+),score=104.41 TRINITY_DN44785_c0_g1_i1:117-1619(+)
MMVRSRLTLFRHSLPVLDRLSQKNLPSNVLRAEYAVRGRIAARAQTLAARIRMEGPFGPSLPFNEVIFCNIGNPQQLGQQPFTYLRQLLAAVTYPALLQPRQSGELVFPADIVDRAKQALRAAGSVGAYTPSPGLEAVRTQVAEYITQRDGVSTALENDIIMTDGASPAVKLALQVLVRSESDGIMIPVPQYPLYSATLALLGGAAVPYFLDEPSGWALDVEEIERAYQVAMNKGVNVRGLVVINPGNPTGTVLSPENVRSIVRWAAKRQVAVLADEVYQANVYAEDKSFYSFRKGVHEEDLVGDLDLFSFHSASKGLGGECGLRAGYLEVSGIDHDVMHELLKLVSMNLCSNVIGQIAMGALLSPPREGDPSYEQYAEERDGIFASLKRRAGLLSATLNSLEGVSCQTPEGSMYAFPRITLPPKAIDAAASLQLPVQPDELYCMELLEATGICVVPGNGFGQRPGEFHFRTTFLPREDRMERVAELMGTFHAAFMNRYR